MMNTVRKSENLLPFPVTVSYTHLDVYKRQDLGYVRDTGDSFHEYYDGERGSIPEEYRVMTFQDDIPEEEDVYKRQP